MVKERANLRGGAEYTSWTALEESARPFFSKNGLEGVYDAAVVADTLLGLNLKSGLDHVR
jgi:hypothetical protein